MISPSLYAFVLHAIYDDDPDQYDVAADRLEEEGEPDLATVARVKAARRRPSPKGEKKDPLTADGLLARWNELFEKEGVARFLEEHGPTEYPDHVLRFDIRVFPPTPADRVVLRWPNDFDQT